MKTKAGIIWGLVFVLVFLLSQDYLFINWTGKPGVYGFPVWIGWFAFVHLLFIIIFFWFSEKYWKE